MSRRGRSSRWLLACLAVACALAASVLAGCAGGGESTSREVREAEVHLDFQRYTLGNGLEVILREDHRLPIAAVNLRYRVGPANEVAGRTGFAHLFEHVMFLGSGHIPQGNADGLLDAAGATNVDASTDFDHTAYYETVPSNALELALWWESDRMGFLPDALGQATLSNAQSVVRNERRENYEVPPYRLTGEEVFHQLFPSGHPYHADVIGSHADIQAARLDEARDFVKHYYVPNNASLAIVGDIDIAETKAMIEKYFGTIPRGAGVPAPKVAIPSLVGERRVRLTDTVQLPKVTMAWLTPPVYAPGDAEADVTAHLLAGSVASRLDESLVRGSRIAQEVGANQRSLALGSVFQIEAIAAPGHTAEELEPAIQRELDALGVDGPQPEELAAAKTSIRTARLFGLESPAGVASLLNLYNQYTGDPGYLDQDLRRHADVDAGAVKRFVTDQLRSDRRLVIHTVPGPKVLPPEPPTPPPPPADTSPEPSSAEPWRATAPQPGPVSTAALPTARRFELANGLPVYLVESHTLPLAVASLYSHWGSAADPPGLAGLAGFSLDMLDQGTQNRDAPGIARELDSLGATLGTTVDDDGSWVTVSALTSHLGRAMAVMSDEVRAPAFAPAATEQVRQQRLVALQQQADQPGTIADRVMRYAVYGAGHPYDHRNTGTDAALRAITRDDLVRFHQQAFSPKGCALVLAGDLTPEQARALAEDAFGGWTGTGADTARPGPPRPDPARVLVVDRPGAAQTTLVLAQPVVAHGDPDYVKLRVLSSMLEAQVNGNLRFGHGYTYGAFSTLSGNRGIGTLELSSNVQTQFTGASVREMLNEVDDDLVTTEPVSPEDVDTTTKAIIRSLPTEFLTDGDSVSAIGRLYLYDLPPDYYQTLPARLANIGVAEVASVARARLRPGEMKVIAVGDRSKIDPQLAALRLGPIAYRTPEGTPTPH